MLFYDKRHVDSHQPMKGLEGTAVSLFMVEDGDQKFLRNVGTSLPDYKASTTKHFNLPSH